jgi:NADH pyrophosphatase NudC (nudix superfamily)
MKEIKEKDIKTVAIALIKNDEGKYLLVNLANYYPSYEEHRDEWCPLAGHVEPGENPGETLTREAKEEFGIEIEPIRQIAEWEQDIPGETAVWWEAKISAGPLRPNQKEIAKYGWFSAEEARQIQLWPATRKFFEKYIWNEN